MNDHSKTRAEKLLTRIQRTRSARFEAVRRIKASQTSAFTAAVLIEIVVIGLSIYQLTQHQWAPIAVTFVVIGSFLSLLISVYEFAAEKSEKRQRIYESGRGMQTLLHKLERISDEVTDEQYNDISSQYEQLIGDESINHTSDDDKAAGGPPPDESQEKGFRAWLAGLSLRNRKEAIFWLVVAVLYVGSMVSVVAISTNAPASNQSEPSGR